MSKNPGSRALPHLLDAANALDAAARELPDGHPALGEVLAAVMAAAAASMRIAGIAVPDSGAALMEKVIQLGKDGPGALERELAGRGEIEA